MKKIFSAKRNALLSSATISWGGGALALVLIILLVRFAAPNIFWRAFAPVFHAADTLALASHTFAASFGTAAALTLQNERLTSENSALASENQALSQKIVNISALSGFSVPQQHASGILAGVLAHPPVSPYDTLVLSAGSTAGVRKGMEVFGAGGVPLGVVETVLADFSRAVLFSAPGMSTYGWVGKASSPVTLVGEGAGTMSALMPRSANIIVGDSVFVPGPGMLPIGSVVRIDDEPSSPSVTLRIMLSQNIFSIPWVLVRDSGTALQGPLFSATSTLP